MTTTDTATVTPTFDADHVTFASEPDVRYTVMHDYHAPDPIADSCADVDHYIYATGWRDRPTPAHGLARVFDALRDRLEDDDAALVATRRYAIAFLGWHPERAHDAIAIRTVRGYAQSDWWDVFVSVNHVGDGNADGWIDEWARYARGDVWFVFPETRTVCDLGETHWTREPHNYAGLGGIYADDAEAAATEYLAIA